MTEIETVSSDLPLVNDLNNSTEEVQTETASVENTEGTETAVEKPAEETPVVDEKAKKAELKAARQFAEIARRENQLNREKKLFKENFSKYQEWEKSRDLAKTDPITYLQNLTNLSFEQIIELSLSNRGNEKPVDPQKKIEERLAQFEKEREEEKAQKQKQDNDYHWKKHLTEVSGYVQKNSDTYEVILSHPDRATDLYKSLVNQAIELADGRALDSEEVIALLDRTEQILTEETQPLFERLSKTKKFSGKLGINKTVPEKTVTDNKPNNTLTNQMASVPVAQTSTGKILTHEEAIEAIRKQFG